MHIKFMWYCRDCGQYVRIMNTLLLISTNLLGLPKITIFPLCLFRHCQQHCWWSRCDNDDLWTHQENVHLSTGHCSFRLRTHKERTRRRSGNYIEIVHYWCQESDMIFTLFYPRLIVHDRLFWHGYETRRQRLHSIRRKDEGRMSWLLKSETLKRVLTGVTVEPAPLQSQFQNLIQSQPSSQWASRHRNRIHELICCPRLPRHKHTMGPARPLLVNIRHCTLHTLQTRK